METTTGMNIRVPSSLHKALKHFSVDHGISMTDMMINAAQRYLEEEAKREKASA